MNLYILASFFLSKDFNYTLECVLEYKYMYTLSEVTIKLA